MSDSVDDQKLNSLTEEQAIDAVLAEFGLPNPSYLPAEIIPVRESTKVVLREFFEIRPTCNSYQQAVSEVSKKLGINRETVSQILQKSAAQKEAKRQREEYADILYSQKLPLAKSIVGKSLVEVDNFLTTFKPSNVQEAKDLVKMATDMTTLLRLELGQSTQQIEIIHKTQKDITVILQELKEADPFMTYEAEDDK